MTRLILIALLLAGCDDSRKFEDVDPMTNAHCEAQGDSVVCYYKVEEQR